MSSSVKIESCEPFLRWAGGKSWLLPKWQGMIKGLKFKNYYEPFVGGGTTFFSLPGAHKCFIADLNQELIITYQMIMNNPEDVVRALKRMRNTETDYYDIRDRKCRNDSTRAARFIYLNQTSYNGLYRVNKKGEYNVPYGFRKEWHYDYDRILNASVVMKANNTQISCCDFAKSLSGVEAGDLVFLDPPYTVSTGSDNGFIEYNEKIFSLDDQRRLCRCIADIKMKGAYYVLTNAAHPTLRKIFDTNGDECKIVRRQSLIGGKNARRGLVKEFIYTNIPGGIENDE